MPAGALPQTIDAWITGLKDHSFEYLWVKPSATAWSLGQLYMHLIRNTDFFLEQARICCGSDEHSFEKMSPAAERMFRNDAFPDAAIEGPADNALTSQPLNKEQLMEGLQRIKHEAILVAALVQESIFRGKTRHPGLQYFNAAEWLQFAEMHFRHHLRQHQRIVEWLEMNYPGK